MKKSVVTLKVGVRMGTSYLKKHILDVHDELKTQLLMAGYDVCDSKIVNVKET